MPDITRLNSQFLLFNRRADQYDYEEVDVEESVESDDEINPIDQLVDYLQPIELTDDEKNNLIDGHTEEYIRQLLAIFIVLSEYNILARDNFDLVTALDANHLEELASNVENATYQTDSFTQYDFQQLVDEARHTSPMSPG